MAIFGSSRPHGYLVACFAVFCLSGMLVTSQLDYRYYDQTCPNLTRIVRSGVWSAILNETRMAASLLRLHFHDCIVNGCDASILLDDTSTMIGEKNSRPNKNSVRGYEVIDNIKANVESACPNVVSCTDIITLAVRDAVIIAGGPYWEVSLGRRDSLTANINDTTQIPSPFDSLDTITAKFASKNLTQNDVVSLSGAHTIGFAQCVGFKSRLFNFNGTGSPDPNLDASLLAKLQVTCPNVDTSNSNLAPLDPITTNRFDNVYYSNLVNNSGLLLSDQELMENNATAAVVMNYSRWPRLFFRDFSASMVKLADVGVFTGSNGQVRKNCRVVN